MTGVVLCGGGSTRMGKDKGLLKEEELTWAQLAAHKIAALHIPFVVSINPQQLEAYRQIFPNDKLIVDDADFAIKAPLFGLLSVHVKKPKEDLLVLACDIKEMTTALMFNLYGDYKQGTHEAYVYQTGRQPQPLCGIYRAAGLEKIYRLYLNDRLTRYSMMHVLERLDTNYILVKEEDANSFNNYNSPNDL